MKKAVISSGGKQYLVAEGDELEIELAGGDKKLTFEPLLVISGNTVQVGTPYVAAKVGADVLEADVAGAKVTAIRYKAKKRVRKVRGHRQRHARIKITKIA